MDDEAECVFCGRGSVKTLWILGTPFCAECAERLSRLQTDDPEYSIWLAIIRRVWTKWAESL